jgi:hypothetical protein
VVTQRRHRTDTGLVITGQTAGQWIAIAQAFAGEAGRGRPPRSAAWTWTAAPQGGAPA